MALKIYIRVGHGMADLLTAEELARHLKVHATITGFSKKTRFLPSEYTENGALTGK
jgi:hypothetical protein